MHGWASTRYVKDKPISRKMKHMFEWVSTLLTERAIVQVFDEQMFDESVLEVFMSAPVATQTAVSFPARRHPLRAVEDAPLATVRAISTAPSVRRRVEAQRVDDPSYLRAPAAPRRRTRSSRRGIIAGALATVVLSVGAGALGLAIQPATYDGPTVTKAVVSGDSVWSLAQNVKTDRPLEQVVADIERMNDVQGALQPGQRVLVPVR